MNFHLLYFPKNGRGFLHTAVQRGSLPGIELMTKPSSLPEHIDHVSQSTRPAFCGLTPIHTTLFRWLKTAALHAVAREDCLPCAKALVEHGADLEATDSVSSVVCLQP